MSIQEIGILGAVLAVVLLILAFGRYAERYKTRQREVLDPKPPIKVDERL
jgi:O-antigen ligase